jgi:hypothetical protein
MPQYKFDAARWCESMTIAHYRKKDFVTAENFNKARLEIEELRAELAALKGTVKMLMGCIEDAKRCPDMHEDFAEELEAAQAVLARIAGDR